MRGAERPRIAVALLPALIACAAPGTGPPPRAAAPTVRVALFNIRELSTARLTAVDADGVGTDPQARAAATIVQRVRPDVLVINEIDHDYDAVAAGAGHERNARRFADAYLATGAAPIEYPYAWAAPNNTGILSGIDLDNDGHVATEADLGTRIYGNDALGYGEYPGRYSMAVLSRHPIESHAARTFRRLLWRDVPGNHLPDGFYSESARAVLPLSSKSHQDVPVVIDGRRLHLFLSHPTPPVFDGEEDRNGRRNWDEIRLWADYLDGASWLVDDAGGRGGYADTAPFVIAGDLNARPDADQPTYEGIPAIRSLLDHPRVQDPAARLVSEGAPTDRPGSTARFGELGVRVDYLLPSTDLEVLAGGVYWPSPETDPEGSRLALEASDHRLVWLDLRLAGRSDP